MTQSVIITSIICFTVITVYLISALTRNRNKDEQRIKDASKVVRDFKNAHYSYDEKKKKMCLDNISVEEMRIFVDSMSSILI